MAYIRYKNYRVRLPGSPWVRMGLAAVLIIGGLPPMGMVLPVLGWGSIAVGMLILSYDMPLVRRWRRRSEVWGLRWWRRHKHNRTLSTARHAAIVISTFPFVVVRAIKRWGRHWRSQLSWYRPTRADIRRTRMRPRRGAKAKRRHNRRTQSNYASAHQRPRLTRSLPFLR
jgi:hypothetical protein